MKTSLSALHHQGNDWKRELDFYIDELAILTSRLDEAGKKNTSEELLNSIKELQNRFIVLREHIDRLRHSLDLREHKIEQRAKERPTHVEDRTLAEDEKILERTKFLAADLADARYKLNKFLAKTL